MLLYENQAKFILLPSILVGDFGLKNVKLRKIIPFLSFFFISGEHGKEEADCNFLVYFCRWSKFDRPFRYLKCLGSGSMLNLQSVSDELPIIP